MKSFLGLASGAVYPVMITVSFWLVAVLIHLFCRVLIQRAKRAPEKQYDIFWQSLKWSVPMMLFLLGPLLGSAVGLAPQNPQLTRNLWIGLLAIALLGAVYIFKHALLYFKKKAVGMASPLDAEVVAIVEKAGWVVLLALLVGFLLALFEIDPTPWLLGIAFASLLLGYLMRDGLSNFFAGVYISMDRPFKDGDIIMLPTRELCRVEQAGWRTTKLYDLLQHVTIIVPNHTLATQAIVNVSQPDSELRVQVDFYLSHDTEIEKACAELVAMAQQNPEVQRTSVKRLKELAAQLDSPELREAIHGVTAGKESLSREEIAMLQRVVLESEVKGGRPNSVKLELAKEPVSFAQLLPNEQGKPLLKLTLYAFVRHLERRLDVITDLYREFQKRFKTKAGT